ncbi:MAG TPA: glucose-6-phosphate dehydrogenase [Candidatus Dormibacteraeota bacterium]|jgi:glucose-6-phosphate 1-dehydrogenase|nr:glucose-6-phosphate dehydrogenase [Candidatus Dormibacteraeota bacterium]
MYSPPDQDIVVVGASGDLAARKLLPALYNLEVEGLLPGTGLVIGYAESDWDDDAFRSHARESIAQFSRTGIADVPWQRFATRLRFINASAGWDVLRSRLEQRQRLVYLAVPPSAFATLVSALGAAGLAEGTSLVIEKPFGRDLATATQLNRDLHAVLAEERIFRIDHYLGKETVQNLLVFRFGNSVFERLWNRDAISQVEITVAESLGVEHRGAFYEETGAIRDIVQNHMFQLLSVAAMEPPISFDAEALRNEKVKVLRAAQPLDPKHTVRGQYAAGTIDGQKVAAYTDEPGVSRTSTTETYAAMRMFIDSWRWEGVPFLLRTGKRLCRRESVVVVSFNRAPLHLFHDTGIERLDSNRLVVRVQPDEGISLSFIAKQPGPALTTQPVEMDFSYGTSFKTSPPEAYERLLHDALLDDHTLFIREDEVERGWAIVDPVLTAPPPVVTYEAGSWGPVEAEAIAGPGHWHMAEEGT